MEPETGNDGVRQDRIEDMPKFESMTVNPGFVPEGQDARVGSRYSASGA